MKNPILRMLIGAILFSLVAGIVVLIIGLMLGWKTSTQARIIGPGHCMMFFFAYPFNRADEADVERARRALEETNGLVLDLGGIPWKAEAPAQRQILGRMDPGTLNLMDRIRAMLDPQGIMNPGNWEVR